MLVGATGLTVALIASLIGPVGVLLQGQAWRWAWVTGFASVMLLAPTILAVWRDEKCGPLYAVLMISAWTISGISGALCAAAALNLFLIRNRIDVRGTMYLRWAAVAVGAVVLAWQIKSAWTLAWPRLTESGSEPLPIALIREILGVGVLAVIVIGSIAYWIRASRSDVERGGCLWGALRDLSI